MVLWSEKRKKEGALGVEETTAQVSSSFLSLKLVQQHHTMGCFIIHRFYQSSRPIILLLSSVHDVLCVLCHPCNIIPYSAL